MQIARRQSRAATSCVPDLLRTLFTHWHALRACGVKPAPVKPILRCIPSRTMQSQQTLTPFPVLFDLDEPAQAWQWPRAPFSWRHVPVPDDNLAQPCRIETPSGMTSDGFMVSMKPAVGSLTIRRTFEGADLLLPLSS